jgi:hypothetical protein
LQRMHGDFALMRNHVGQNGWVKRDEIARVIPSPPPRQGS